jgi:porphyrinogen peroxidase
MILLDRIAEPTTVIDRAGKEVQDFLRLSDEAEFCFIQPRIMLKCCAVPNADSTGNASSPQPSSPQAIVTGPTSASLFLVVTIDPRPESATAVRSLCPDLANLLRAVGFRDTTANLSCVMSFGSAAWDRLFGEPRPAELHPFREIIGGSRHAVSTPGDVLFHIRAARTDLCFELAAQIMTALGDAVSVEDEIQAFRYFDNRDLLGFVDGTENPVDQEALDAVLITDEDPAFTDGSYVIVQKYLHDLTGWNALQTEVQERIIGRTKVSDIELPDGVKPTSAHNALNTIVEGGVEIKIFRANGIFGRPGQSEFGTYFIGYAKTPSLIEKMLQNMFIGSPPGNYDRILDFSRAVTGSLFFTPPASFLDGVTPDGVPAAPAPTQTGPSPDAQRASDGSLGIGSLKGESRDE